MTRSRARTGILSGSAETSETQIQAWADRALAPAGSENAGQPLTKPPCQFIVHMGMLCRQLGAVFNAGPIDLTQFSTRPNRAMHAERSVDLLRGQDFSQAPLRPQLKQGPIQQPAKDDKDDEQPTQPAPPATSDWRSWRFAWRLLVFSQESAALPYVRCKRWISIACSFSQSAGKISFSNNVHVPCPR